MTVHLARKWRSKNFNELVGQELSVRLLKNSLYKKAFFPAYLFSGLRGSGKTSMGRIFAAAVNCEQLDEFIKAPQIVILPCSICMSCKALFAGQHPDFIEIDAASHTGVDNMRLIIENASMLPTLARKKIYLIDEAHMLSKAAFNAALKILEEPPVHVMFILATTDPEKIIETIKSRCFQIFFDPIPSETLIQHLQKICQAEAIDYDSQGLDLLAQQSGGSARDALTMLERVALAEDNKVTGDSVSRVLGIIGRPMIMKLYGFIENSNTHELLMFLKTNRYNAHALWKELTVYIRSNLYYPKYIQNKQKYEQALLHLKISYQTEQLLARTSMADAVVEYMLLSMCNSGSVSIQAKTLKEPEKKNNTELAYTDTVVAVAQSPKQSVSIPQWIKFVDTIKTEVEPLVYTLFSSAQATEFDQVTSRCSVQCLKEHELFKEWLDNSALIWKPFLLQAFGVPVELDIKFVLAKTGSLTTQRIAPRHQQKTVAQKIAVQRAGTPAADQSQTVLQALKIFPGTIQEV
ncbi:MAG: DNA polymerase III subunit gamma/tau [Candidatus Babeliaceae bacterium]|nr:DNA polymerase III subunit gamma/tau [Candidatus Babeliaceae bacterium]